MSSTTITAAGSRSSSCATRYSHALTSSTPELRENLCCSTPHCEGNGRGARNVDVPSVACAMLHAAFAPAAPAVQPTPMPTGPRAAERAPRATHAVLASPSWSLPKGSSSQVSNAALPTSSARNDLPEPLGPVKCRTQSLHVARAARPVYDSKASRT
eukprot:3925132-Prymnesium_polylepis.2